MSTTTPVAEKWTRILPIALLVLVIGLALSYLLIFPHPTTLSSASISTSGSSLEVGRAADAARYTAMAEFYAAQTESIQQGRKADAARYTAMAEFYNAKAADTLRVLEADTARYTAMAKYYTEKEAIRVQRSLNADATRYTAMAEYYMKMQEVTSP
jgi:hypothetical protein